MLSPQPDQQGHESGGFARSRRPYYQSMSINGLEWQTNWSAGSTVMQGRTEENAAAVADETTINFLSVCDQPPRSGDTGDTLVIGYR